MYSFGRLIRETWGPGMSHGQRGEHFSRGPGEVHTALRRVVYGEYLVGIWCSVMYEDKTTQ